MSFGPDVGQGDDDDDTGGSSNVAGTSNGTGGSSNVAGSGTTAGTDSDEGGAGTSAGGSEAGGSENGGTSSGGTDTGGSSAGSGGANVAGSGGTGGSAGSGNESGSGGTGNGGGGAGNGGTGGGGAGGTGGSGGSPTVTCTPSELFLGHNYVFCTEVDSAMAGYEKCQSLGMSMVTIESKQENAYVLGKQKGGCWLGGTDDGHEKDWIWATGVYFTKNDKPVQGVYSNWLDGQPNNDNKDGLNENCLVMTSTGGWNDLACTLGGSKVTCESSGPGIPMP